MDLLKEQLARTLELMGQHSGMQVTEPEDVYDDLDYVHPKDQELQWLPP